jgi:fatty-acyl-CoA synthase
MQTLPLTVEQLFRRAQRPFGQKRIYSSEPGGVTVTTYADWARRTEQLANALRGMGLEAGARVATFASNTIRHLEVSFAAPLSGYVFHPLNVRLPEDQLCYVVNDAADEVIFVDRALLTRLASLIGSLKTVRQVVVMNDGAESSAVDVAFPERIILSDYEQLIASSVASEFHVEDENCAASVCYTSGTTGNPKGVVYSQRSVWLHAMSLLQIDAAAISESDTVLPLVPFFHANAWGLGYAAVAAGADLVLPGSDMSGQAVASLMENCRVTCATAVPALWSRILPELHGRDASHLRMLCSGGSAVPARLTDLCRELTGNPIMQVWGMTETGAYASMARSRPHIDPGDPAAQSAVTSSQGVPVAGVDFRIVRGDTLEELPWDGESTGELQCRGPWVIRGYHGEGEPSASVTSDGWFRTGDAASIDHEGYIRLRDRLKDLIKSGGEWIPSVELEAALQAHPSVESVAVIGVPSERWDERPIALITLVKDCDIAPGELLDWLRPRIVKFWIPDEIHVLQELPITSVGKVDKKALRHSFALEMRP